MILDEIAGFRFNKTEWDLVDLRIDIPRLGPGSDAINVHTQYSNPVACFNGAGLQGVGAGFTLGLGNDLICAAASELIMLWEGRTVGEVAAESGSSPYHVLTNPHQIRWLSPNAGVQYQAAGLIVNTIIDAVAKRHSQPAWRLMLEVGAEERGRFYGDLVNLSWVDAPRCDNVSSQVGVTPEVEAYHTTWIGSSVEALSAEICDIFESKGVTTFKIKVGRDVEFFTGKVRELRQKIPCGCVLAVDANQTLSLGEACGYLESDEGILWLEEPFAPDNVPAFEALAELKARRGYQVEIATGENCPSPHVAASLMDAGIDRFQPDPCRMLGFVDAVLVSDLASRYSLDYTPHAGGSCLDEMSAHLACYHAARHGSTESRQLVENVGFCGRFMEVPSQVESGRLSVPASAGFLVGFNQSVTEKFVSYREGVTWLTL